jgi:hypothetical protein
VEKNNTLLGGDCLQWGKSYKGAYNMPCQLLPAGYEGIVGKAGSS